MDHATLSIKKAEGQVVENMHPTNYSSPLLIDVDSSIVIGGAIQTLINEITRTENDLSNLLGGCSSPPEITQMLRRLRSTAERFPPIEGGQPITISPDPTMASILRASLALTRRRQAEKVELQQKKLTSPSVIRELDDSLMILNLLLDNSALSSVVPIQIPTLADFVSADARRKARSTVPDRFDEERDPKHRILLSSSLIPRDIANYRKECEDRHLPFGVVFADLDDFKSFNIELGEPRVDREILPKVLTAVESSVYGHGGAYRHGGDEFVLLLPNADVDLIRNLSNQLKDAVEDVTFDSTTLRPKISVGVWITTAGSHLTGNELIMRASEAKAESKALGKSKITIRKELGSTYETPAR